jgi:hypothetical protein
MKKKTSLLLLLTVILCLQSCSGDAGRFVGRWKVYSSQSKSDKEPFIETLDDFYIFRDDAFMRSGYGDYSEYWGSDSQPYEAADGKLTIWYEDHTTIANEYTYEFITDTRLKLTWVEEGSIMDGYEIVLDRIGDE